MLIVRTNINKMDHSLNANLWAIFGCDSAGAVIYLLGVQFGPADFLIYFNSRGGSRPKSGICCFVAHVEGKNC